ncbi:MAG: exodeoxyribonuclease III [Zetaproteobacteria bacterium]|nr:MAG: exodeoxyribonuclease III [Zetaproteobacteria bacterium]
MKIVSCNINGIRSAASKGFFDWFAENGADILCLQEIKAQTHQIPKAAHLAGYETFFLPAERPGYAGVALYSRRSPDTIWHGIQQLDPNQDWQTFDAEGRYLQADFGSLSVISVYFPSGSSTHARQARKMVFLERFLPFIQRLHQQGRELIICGDINIAHQRIDLKNWRGNQKNSGFLPEERAWFGRLLDSGFVDVFRHLYPQREAYSWWSNRGQARAKDVGWRIDYHLCTRAIAAAATGAGMHDRHQRFSDHTPIWATFDYPGF